jgi:hypothetical protein
MKSKLALPALIVSCSAALFSVYVVYAQRQALPAALEAAPVNLPASADEHVVTGSNIEGPVFRSSSLPLTSDETTTAPPSTENSPSPQFPPSETVRFRVNESTVMTRTAPVEPVQAHDHTLKPGIFRNRMQPKLISVPLSPAPVEAVAHNPTAQTATPRPRLLAPGSKAMDLRIPEQPPASPKTETSAPAAESLALDKPTAS